MQDPFIAAVQVPASQYRPELQEVHAAHIVSTDPEQTSSPVGKYPIPDVMVPFTATVLSSVPPLVQRFPY
jgi:hypothetical protein